MVKRIPADVQSIQEKSVDPFLGLTSDLRFVRDALRAGSCACCGSPLNNSMEASRRFAIACPSPTCAFILQPRAMLPATH